LASSKPSVTTACHHRSPLARSYTPSILGHPGAIGGVQATCCRVASRKRPARLGACMRKLVMLSYGVLRNHAPFDPAWSSKKTR